MYKKQMVFEKIICLLAVLIAAAVFIYSLGIMTDLYDCLYSTMRNPYDLTETSVDGSFVYYEMQGFNKAFVRNAIILVVFGCFLFITNTHTRRRYYIANYLSTGLFAGFSLYLCIWGSIQIKYYKSQWLKIDFEALKAHADMWKTTYTESTFWFDAHYLLFGILIIVAGLLCFNLVWKKQLEKEEQKLIQGGLK